MKKKYNNFEELDRDLEILKLERELQWRKLVLTATNTSETLTPNNIAKDLVGRAVRMITPSAGTSVILPLVFRFFMNRLLKKK